MTPKERVIAAIKQQEVDGIPSGFSYHFPKGQEYGDAAIEAHLKYFRETMNEEGHGVGKKLGFIAQEMGREINTTGSKSNQAEMQNIVVKMKDELEQIKEQVLNAL